MNYRKVIVGEITNLENAMRKQMPHEILHGSMKRHRECQVRYRDTMRNPTVGSIIDKATKMTYAKYINTAFGIPPVDLVYLHYYHGTMPINNKTKYQYNKINITTLTLLLRLHNLQ